MYNYKLSSAGCSSSRVGNCEICNKFVSDVYIQTKSKKYDYKGYQGYSHVSSTFGHNKCLEGVRQWKKQKGNVYFARQLMISKNLTHQISTLFVLKNVK
jgi:hypothetical protein